MKITKILVALSFLFATSVHAGELTVTGNMQATWHTGSGLGTAAASDGGNNGNPLGMDRELKFAGTTELDNGMTVSVMQDTTDALAFGDSLITFGNVMGLVDIYVGSDGDPVDAIDDVTPTAFEEANGAGSGTYVDVNGNAGQTGVGIKFSLPMLGTVNTKYYPKIDGSENADKASSANANAGVGSAFSLSTVTSLGDVYGALDGATLRVGYAESEVHTLANTSDAYDATMALNYAYGPLSLGYQKQVASLGDPVGTVATTDEIFYKNDIYGVAYAINDALSISYNKFESYRHSTGAATTASSDQDTVAYNIGYTIGGMTIGFQDASTDNANFVTGNEDNTKTLSVAVAF
jgi:outer membrane protein OmpU